MTLLHEFGAGARDAGVADGGSPYGGLVQWGDQLIGTTAYGGAHGLGAAFTIDGDGTYAVRGAFDGSNGAWPAAGLAPVGDGRFATTTMIGGDHDLGAVIQVEPSGAIATLHSFADVDGAYPAAGLFAASDGRWYGTTQYGGRHGHGTIYRMDADGVTTIHHFSGTDGSLPLGDLVERDGRLFGTTFLGGSIDAGSIFSITLGATPLLTVEHEFTGPEGSYPTSGLTLAPDATLWGVASAGGASAQGTAYRLDTAGVVTAVHAFEVLEGSSPNAPMTLGPDGRLYGSTVLGGSGGQGTIFRIDPVNGELTTIHEFDGSNGAQPYGALWVGSDGFYGTTAYGGAANQGVVFRVEPQRTSLSVARVSGVFGEAATLSATLTFGDEPVAGRLVAFSLNETDVASAVTDENGVARVENARLSGVDAGTYPGGAHATAPGDAVYAAASADADLVVRQATPALTWQRPEDIDEDGLITPQQLNATANVEGVFTYLPRPGVGSLSVNTRLRRRSSRTRRTTATARRRTPGFACGRGSSCRT